jgi:hypothetical protein
VNEQDAAWSAAFERVRQIALTFPGVAEGQSHGTPALKVGKKLLAVLHDDGETLVLQVGRLEQEYLIDVEPEIYYITDHYRGTPFLRVRLSKIDPAALQEVFEQAWRRLALKRDIAVYDARQ